MSSITLERPVEHVGALVVLGKNIGVGSSPEDIRANKFHLSPESRMNALAAGMLYQRGMKLIFSTGQTAGEDVPSEARAMYNYARKRYPEILPEDVILGENSIDTAGNAEEVADLLRAKSMEGLDIGLLTVGYHALAAAKLFRTKGVPILRHFIAEDVLRSRSSLYGVYIDAWANTPRIRRERQKEFLRNILLSTIDENGELLRKVTQRTRG